MSQQGRQTGSPASTAARRAAAPRQVSTRVTRRSEEWQGDDRLSTSEFFQQLITSPQAQQPKVRPYRLASPSVARGVRIQS